MHWIWITIIYSNFRILLRVLHLLWARPRSPIWFAETARGLVTQTKTVHTKTGPSQARSKTVKRSTGTATTAYSKFGICLLSKSKCTTHRSIETHACTLGKSIGLNYPHAWTNGKLLCGKKHTTNSFVLHNPIKTHNFKISSCQKCDFQLNQTTDLHF